jgi:hypothetical protein
MGALSELTDLLRRRAGAGHIGAGLARQPRWLLPAIAAAGLLVASAAHAEPSRDQVEYLDRIISIANHVLDTKERYLSREGNALVVNMLLAGDPKNIGEMRKLYRNDPTRYPVIIHYATLDNVCKGDFRRYVEEGFDLVYRWYDDEGPIIDGRVQPGECK